MKLQFSRGPSLRHVIVGLAIAALILPFAVGFVVSLLFTVTSPRVPVMRLEYLSRELGQAIEVESNQTIIIKSGYLPPKGLGLVIVDSDARVLLSTDQSIAKGSRVALDEIVAAMRKDSPANNFFAETLRMKDHILGHYYAWIPEGFDAPDPRRSSTFILVLVGLVGIACVMGVLIATHLARSVLKLERAAGQIASGDLESPVSGGGRIREIAALSAAMDGMRLKLREDRDQRARFLAAISHDLRTPLTSIGGYLEAVDDGLASNPQTMERYIHIMRDKTRLLETRIASLIEFAHMETGDWRMGFETVKLKDFLESLGRELKEDAELLGRNCIVDLEALGDIEVAVDRALLSRAFENLVSNAIRYSPPGTSIALGARANPEYLYIDIDDQGPGIAPSERDKVFEAFVRGSGAREGEGSGLGLYIVRSVVRGHGWEVHAGLSPQGGGRFTVTIPNRRLHA